MVFYRLKNVFLPVKKGFIFNFWPLNYKFYKLQVELHVINQHLIEFDFVCKMVKLWNI